jgi:hypothetical protein
MRYGNKNTLYYLPLGHISVRTVDVTCIFKLSLFLSWNVDLEPSMPRPKTSARTTERLIPYGMGLKKFSSSSPSKRKEQEEARRSQITAKQAACDDAWGSD